jgi:hypothetical protein
MLYFDREKHFGLRKTKTSKDIQGELKEALTLNSRFQ